jgi:hypothetical protein
VRRTTLCGRPVLMLPHFSQADLTNEEVKKNVKVAIDNMVAQGILKKIKGGKKTRLGRNHQSQ